LENWFCRNSGGFTGILKNFGVKIEKNMFRDIPRDFAFYF
jgi:hypothetical protein